MEHRRLGSTDIEVSVVGLGANNFGSSFVGHLDLPRSRAVVDAALDAGINFIDTADYYGDRGNSEAFLGEILAGRRERVVIATKFGEDMEGRNGDDRAGRGSPAYIRRAIEASLRRLRTDYVDLYLYHRPDGTTPVDETLGALDELVARGVVRAVGCSNFTPGLLGDAARAADERALTPFAVLQNEYSLLERGAERELLPLCGELGMGFIPYFPLASGLLSGKYALGRPAPDGSRLAERPARPGRRAARAGRGAARVRRRARPVAARAGDVLSGLQPARRVGDRGRDAARAGAGERGGRRLAPLGRGTHGDRRAAAR